MLARRRKQRGFTLVEALVTVLILAILVAVMVPLYLQSVTRSATTACQSNLHMLMTVSFAWKTIDAAHKFPTAAQLDTQLPAEGQPVLASILGPNNETYTYTQGANGDSFTIKCNASPTHGTYDSTTGQIQ